MKLRFNIYLVLFVVCSLFSYQRTSAQCFQIESILVAACVAPAPAPNQEGLNEMVRFKVGSSSLNVNNLSVTWPVSGHGIWPGVIQNAASAVKVAQLNADIIASGGIGKVIEPPGGIIPPNSKVILVTSYNMDTVLNSFGALSDTIYIIFQNNPANTTGHFSNTNSGTLNMSFSGTGGCSDSVSYIGANLVKLGGKTVGATVNFTPSGTATYVNNGCVAPVEIFTVDAGTTPISGCPGATVSLSGTAQGQQSVAWSAANGSFSASTSLNTNYTIDATATGTIVLTLEATNAVGTKISDTVTLNITSGVTPTFNAIAPVCQNAIAPFLPPSSTNSPVITGTWSPAVSTASVGTIIYTFTPNTGQCANQGNLSITVNAAPTITPKDYTGCGAGTVVLGATPSSGTVNWYNAITGGTSIFTGTSYTPSITATTSYWVAATDNGCTTNPRVEVKATITSNGAIPAPTVKSPVEYCLNSTAAQLTATTTAAGATLNWYTTLTSTPALPDAPIPSTSTVGSVTYYVSQTIGSCEGPRAAIEVKVIADTGAKTNRLFCDPSQATAANTVFIDWENIVGRSNDYGYSYSIGGGPLVFGRTIFSSLEIFGVLPGVSVTFTILDVPGFPCYVPQTLISTNAPDFAPIAPICFGGTVPTLESTSPNGVIGIWNPSSISNTTSGSYEFTPNKVTFPCAAPQTLNVTITPKVTPTFTGIPTSICQNASAPILPKPTNSPAISGNWNPPTIDTSVLGKVTYTFTPTSGLCANPITVDITIDPVVVPILACYETLGTFNNATCKWNVIGTQPTPPILACYETLGTFDNATCKWNVSGTQPVPPVLACYETLGTFNNATCKWNVIGTQPAPPILACYETLGTFDNATCKWNVSGTQPAPPILACYETLGTFNNATCKWNVIGTQPVLPTFNPIEPICFGATLFTLPTTSLNGVTGTWSPALNTTATTTYTFTYTTGSCVSSIQMVITVNPITAPTFNPIGSVCKGTNIILPTTSINNITGTWTPAFNSSVTTTYTFTPDAGQCATPTNQTVTIIQLPVATRTTGPTSICSGDKTFINLFSDILGTTFTWNAVQTNSTGANAGSGTRIEPNLFVTGNKSGEAVYSITPNNNGCKGSSIEVVITVNPIPQGYDNTEKSTICSGTSTNISLTSDVVGTTYTWKINPTDVLGASDGSGDTIQQELSTVGLVQGNVVYTITPSTNGCTGTPFDVTITVDPSPDISTTVAKNTICSGESIKIDLSSTLAGTLFNWTVIQTRVLGASSGTGTSIEQVLTAGTVAGTAVYTITPIRNGCEGSSTIETINVNPLPVTELENGVLCVRLNGTLKSSYILDTNLSDTDYDFVWYQDDLPIPIIPPATAIGSSYEAVEIGDYYVNVTNKVTGCAAESNTATITQINPAEYMDQPIVTDAFTDNATITINVFPPSDSYLYQIDNGGLQSSNVFSQVKGGTHIIRVTDAIGCTELSKSAPVISYPKFFTPNGDGFNDTWNIIGLSDQPNSKLFIFDRHGKLLKEISTFGNGWDGTYNGQLLPSTDYWFTVNYFENNIIKLFKAHFSLKR